MPVNQPTYHVKANDTIDSLAVHVRATGSQTVYQAGTASTPDHGGWISGSGQIEISVNTPQIHADRYGNLTGALRPTADGGHGIRYVILDRGPDDVAPESHRDFVDPTIAWSFHDIVNGSPTLTLTLNVGQTLWVCYGPESVFFRKQASSDGITVYCVAGLPEPRGGLWGTNRTGDYDVPLWNRMRQVVIDAEPTFEITALGKTFSGPTIGNLPNPLPVDYKQDTNTNSNMNEQVSFMASFLTHRGMQKIRDERNGLVYPGTADMQTLMDLALRATLTGAVDDDPNFQHNLGSFGWKAYPPFRMEAFMGLLIGMVALDMNPNDERVNRILGHFAQAAPAHGTHHSSRLLDNVTVDGGLAAHVNDNLYTQWLATTPEGTPPESFGFRGSHEMMYQSICVVATALLSKPLPEPVIRSLTVSGRDGNGDSGHSVAPSGAPSGHNIFYASLEMDGAMLLRVLRVQHQTTFVRYASRSILTQPGSDESIRVDRWWSRVAQARWVEEVNGFGVSGTSSANLTWTAIAGAASYNIYRGDSATTMAMVDTVAAPTVSFADSPGNGTFFYAVSAVNGDGHEGSHSDPIEHTVSGSAAPHEVSLLHIGSPERLNPLQNIVEVVLPGSHPVNLLQIPSPQRLNLSTIVVNPDELQDAEAADLWNEVVGNYDANGLLTLTNVRTRSALMINDPVGRNAARAVIDLWPLYAQAPYDPNNGAHVEAARQAVIAQLWRRGGSASEIEQVKWDEVWAPGGIVERVRLTDPRAHARPSSNSGTTSSSELINGRRRLGWSDPASLAPGTLPTPRTYRGG